MTLIKKIIIALFLLVTFAYWIHSETKQIIKISVGFKPNSNVIDTHYSNNAAQIQALSDSLRKIRQDSSRVLTKIIFSGSSSPEGSYEWNYKLSRKRRQAIEKEVRNKVEIPDSIVTHVESYIDWQHLTDMVSTSSFSKNQKILDIINQEPYLIKYNKTRHIDKRVMRLKGLDNGAIWRKLHRLYFKHMRNASVTIVTEKIEQSPIDNPIEQLDTIAKIDTTDIANQISDTLTIDSTNIVLPQAIDSENWIRRLYIKTNAIGLGLGIANISAEIDLTKHWSFTLPIYYSAWNYFKYTNKFRTFAIQPEVRYWLNENNHGFFAGAHFTYAQYNVGLNGNDYRYKDHNGNSPALGGGISVGYKLPISRNNKWHIEFSIGAGVYDLYYDKFYNVPNGKLVNSYHKTYWGIDNAAINISYRFDLNKRKK